jgi:HEAT repeat protein
VTRTAIIAAMILGAVARNPASGQTPIAQRVTNAPDGLVRMQYASRPGTCGDGGEAVGFRKAFFMESMQSFGSWSAPQCVPGPVRVALTVRNGRVTRVQTYVGGSWARSTERVTDLGTVSPVDAGAYFFGIVPQLEGRSRKERLLLPAVLADDPAAIQRLTALAKDGGRTEETRHQAIQWIGLIGDASVVPTLVSFARSDRSSARSDDDGEGPGEEGLATGAVAALSFIQDGAGVPALIDLAHKGGAQVRRSAVFWLGQTGDRRAFAALHEIIENGREVEAVRARAIFSLSHGDDVAPEEFAYLRAQFPRLGSERLKEAVLMGMAEDESGDPDWLLQTASNGAESLELRKKALFWAGQRGSTPTKDIVAFYQRATDEELREHAIFVLSQRDDEAALNELLRIARDDRDRDMRKRALFWLAQKDDPRVTKLISDRVSR